MRGALAAGMCLAIAGCHSGAQLVGGPWTLSPEAETLAGMRAAPATEARYGGVIRDARAEQRMQWIGERLITSTSELRGAYEFRLLNTTARNAVSLPGGRIYLSRALYERLGRDDLIAAVIAHEMAHIYAKDHFKPRCATESEALEREFDADRRGVGYLRNAGIGPKAMIDVLNIITDEQPNGWADSRVSAIERFDRGIIRHASNGAQHSRVEREVFAQRR